MIIEQGTWQFISVFALDRPEYPLRVADDLESFLYVIVYNSMRYFNNTLDSVCYQMSTFFDSFTVGDNTYKCGVSKRYAMRVGEIALEMGDTFVVLGKTDVERPHPLNDLIADMLSWFQARYELIVQDRASASASKKKSFVDPVRVMDDEYEEERKKEKEEEEKQRRDGLKRRESKITSHGAMWRLFSSALRKPWPTDDKVGDRLVHDSDDDATSDTRPAKRAKSQRKPRFKLPPPASNADLSAAVPPKATATRGGRGLANRRPSGRATKSRKR